MVDILKDDDSTAGKVDAADETKVQHDDRSEKRVETVSGNTSQPGDDESSSAGLVSSSDASVVKLAPRMIKAAPRKMGPMAKSSSAKSSSIKPSGTEAGGPSVAGVSRKANNIVSATMAAPRKKTAVGPSRSVSSVPHSASAPRKQPLTIQQLKEKIMSVATPDYTGSMNDAVSEMQDRSKAAYTKSSEMMTDVSDVAKGNVEAMVESGKIFSTGMQDMAKTYVEDAKSAYEQMTADLKDMAAIKSPTELLQLQGKIMRRNFELLVSGTSKNAEQMMKLSNEAIAPLTARAGAATEKMSQPD